MKKSGQQSIRGKKELAKCWNIQTKVFQSIYEERADILRDEWLAMKAKVKKKKSSSAKRKSAGQFELPSKKVLSEAEVVAVEKRKEIHLEQQFKERKACFVAMIRSV